MKSSVSTWLLASSGSVILNAAGVCIVGWCWGLSGNALPTIALPQGTSAGVQVSLVSQPRTSESQSPSRKPWEAAVDESQALNTLQPRGKATPAAARAMHATPGESRDANMAALQPQAMPVVTFSAIAIVVSASQIVDAAANAPSSPCDPAPTNRAASVSDVALAHAVIEVETNMDELSSAEPLSAADNPTGDAQAIASAIPGAATAGVTSGPVATHGNRAPEYPPDARRRREAGTVWLHVVIEDDGRVSDVALSRSSGFGQLDTAALEAVRKWRFTPAREHGRAIRCAINLPIEFILRG